MNPGYLSFLIYLTVCIMTVFGWRRTWFGTYLPSGVYGFLAGYALCWLLPWPDRWSPSPAYIWIVAWSLYAAFNLRRNRLQAAATAVLAASVYVTTQALYARYPLSPVTLPVVDIALFIGAIVFVSFQGAREQLPVLGLGLLLGDFLYASGLDSQARGTGSPEFWDCFWLTFGVARVLTGITNWTTKLFQLEKG